MVVVVPSNLVFYDFMNCVQASKLMGLNKAYSGKSFLRSSIRLLLLVMFVMIKLKELGSIYNTIDAVNIPLLIK